MKKQLLSTLMLLTLLPTLSSAGAAIAVTNHMSQDEVHFEGQIIKPSQTSWAIANTPLLFTALIESAAWKIKHIINFAYTFGTETGKLGYFTIYSDGVAKGTLTLTGSRHFLDPNRHFTLIFAGSNGHYSGQFSEDNITTKPVKFNF